MTWYCMSCGNQESFRAYQEYTEWGTERIYFDGNGDIMEYGDRDSSDGEGGDWDEIQCAECEGHEVDEFDDERIAEMDRVRQSNDGSETNWRERIEGG